MLDKEKINEMASDMDYGCTKHDLWPDDAKEIAKALIILGYQKVKEDEMVVSKKEYEELKQDCADIAEHYQEMGRFYDEKCEECDRISKEIAEKIIKNILGLIYCLDFETDSKDYDEGFFDAVKTIISRIEHVAKLNGVEIKE